MVRPPPHVHVPAAATEQHGRPRAQETSGQPSQPSSQPAPAPPAPGASRLTTTDGEQAASAAADAASRCDEDAGTEVAQPIGGEDSLPGRHGRDSPSLNGVLHPEPGTPGGEDPMEVDAEEEQRDSESGWTGEAAAGPDQDAAPHQAAGAPTLIIRDWGSAGGGFVPFGAPVSKATPKGGKARATARIVASFLVLVEACRAAAVELAIMQAFNTNNFACA